jgi:sulfonate transport system ATP-binding protein
MQINPLEEKQVSRAAGQALHTPQHGVSLQLRGLGKHYGGRTVLDAIDLDIAPGEFVAIVGRSGCGKSTLLRAIAGLEQPDAGQLRIGGSGSGTNGSGTSGSGTSGSGTSGTPEVRMMFQDARLLPWKTVLQNVALGLANGEERARAALASVGLAERAGEWPSVLSGGQRQRVALARALVHEPQLLLLDEPLGALDALTRIEMQQLIEALWTRRGFTAVLVTHDVQEAVVLADRILLIQSGRLALDQNVALARPRARGSAHFGSLEQKVLDKVLEI